MTDLNYEISSNIKNGKNMTFLLRNINNCVKLRIALKFVNGGKYYGYM